MPDVAEIWADPAIEGVIICSETNRHEPLVLAAAGSGKHLFAEKPLGMGAVDAYRMADAIEDAGVLFQTGYFMRGNPIHLFLREQLAAAHSARSRGSGIPIAMPVRWAAGSTPTGAG